MPETEKTLLLDIIQKQANHDAQFAVLQGNIALILANHARAEEDRKEIKEQVSKINGRIRILERAHDNALGAMWAVRTFWIVIAGLVGAAVSWALKKLGAI